MPRDYSTSKKPYWRNNKFWVCPNHLPSAKIPAEVPTCWFSNCKSVRPKRSSGSLVLVKETKVYSCAWKNCNKDNGNQAKRRERSKYCSTDCKNRNARWRYNEKKKREKHNAR